MSSTKHASGERGMAAFTRRFTPHLLQPSQHDQRIAFFSYGEEQSVQSLAPESTMAGRQVSEHNLK